MGWKKPPFSALSGGVMWGLLDQNKPGKRRSPRVEYDRAQRRRTRCQAHNGRESQNEYAFVKNYVTLWYSEETNSPVMKTMPLPIHQIDDHQLVQLAAEGSREAFGELVSRHHLKVRAMLWRSLGDESAVDDVAQEVFMSALSGVSRFRQQASFSTWLLAIARNKAISHLRKKCTASGKTVSGLDLAVIEHQIQILDEGKTEPANLDALRNCVTKLSDSHRQLVQEIYFNERSTAELSAATGVARNTLRMQLMRIRRALAGCIERNVE
ncbi:MAG: RNA polymerase sigma factor [Pirellulaceae bacterium]|nr:RNA polymerase sigma factor [Pirellulaceae bacterium]